MQRTGMLIQGKSYVFQGALAANTSAVYEMDITSSGHIDKVSVKFAAGENGTLHITPMVIQNGEIPQFLAAFSPGLNNYVSGDDEYIELPCFIPVENGSKIRIIADNQGAYASFVDVIVSVQYRDAIREVSVIN